MQFFVPAMSYDRFFMFLERAIELLELICVKPFFRHREEDIILLCDVILKQ